MGERHSHLKVFIACADLDLVITPSKLTFAADAPQSICFLNLFWFFICTSLLFKTENRKSGALGKQSQSLWLPFYCIVPFRHVYIKADKLCLLWQLNKLPVSPSVFGLENKGTKVASGTGKQNTSPQPADPLSNYFCQGYRMFQILQVWRVF